MNNWQKINYKFFLANDNLTDSPELREAYMSGFNLAEHIRIYGYPDTHKPSNKSIQTDTDTEAGQAVRHNRS